MKNGTIVEINGRKWKVLDQTEKGFFCICEKIDIRKFDRKSNNYANSDIRKYLNSDVLEELEVAVGAENIIPFERDLISLCGLKEYGTCEDKVSLISVDEYRKYRELLPRTGEWWWTLTPDSTAGNGDERWVDIVSPSGYVGGDGCYIRGGVRPVCIFSSSIFESGVAKEIE